MSLAYRAFLRLLILLFFFMLAVAIFAGPAPTPSPARPRIVGGTLVAYFVTRDEIYLFSDGRAIDHGTGEIYDDWCKVHRINERVGMLEGGIYIPNLATDIARESRRRKITSADEIAALASEIMKRSVRDMKQTSIDAPMLDSARFYIIIAGFDHRDRPRVFLIDSENKTPFTAREQSLNLANGQVAIGAISTHSGSVESPAMLLRQALIPDELEVTSKREGIAEEVRRAFEKTKLRVSENNPAVGGHSYSAIYR